MASELLSSKTVQNAKCKINETTNCPRETLLSDGNGLYLRLRPTNTTSKTLREWVFIYTANQGKRRKLTLGGYPDHSLSDAREWARVQRQMIDRGADPHDTRRTEQEAANQRSEKSLDALLSAYLFHLEKQGKLTAEQRSIFKCHIPNELLKRSAASIHKNEIASAVRAVLNKGRKRTADKLRVYIGAAYNAALTADIDPRASSELLGFGIESNPATYVKRIPDGGSATHDRTLSQEEISHYLFAIAALPEGDEKDILLMQLLIAGQRLRQLACATIQTSNGDPEIVIADKKGRRSKARMHRVPLTGPAFSLYQCRGRLFEYMDTVNADGTQTIGPLTRLCDKLSRWVTEISDDLIGAGKITKPFKGGAIRRTAETWFMSQGYSRDLVGQLQSHGIAGIQAKHYDRHDYRKEKIEMLDRWHSYILQQVPNELRFLAAPPDSTEKSEDCQYTSPIPPPTPMPAKTALKSAS